MVQNKLETYLSGVLHNIKDKYKNIYYMKLQVNQMAHKRTVADFLLLTNNYNYAIECKMSENDTFYLNRLTQEIDLQIFSNAIVRNRSYVVLLFWLGSAKKSKIYLCTVEEMLQLKEQFGAKIRVEDLYNQTIGTLVMYDYLEETLLNLFRLKNA